MLYIKNNTIKFMVTIINLKKKVLKHKNWLYFFCYWMLLRNR